MRGTLRVQRGDAAPFVMHPEKRLYKVQQMPMTEAAIDSGLWRDLYVSLGEPLGADTWTVRVYHKPFVDWIWFGALAMALQTDDSGKAFILPEESAREAALTGSSHILAARSLLGVCAHLSNRESLPSAEAAPPAGRPATTSDLADVRGRKVWRIPKTAVLPLLKSK